MSKSISPSIRFSLSDYRICINMATLACLDNPLYIRLLFESERKMLAISEADEEEYNACKIPERLYVGRNKEFRINRRAFTEAFRVRMNWDFQKTYRAAGVHSPECSAVVFDLNEAIIITGDVSEGRDNSQPGEKSESSVGVCDAGTSQNDGEDLATFGSGVRATSSHPSDYSVDPAAERLGCEGAGS